jgi:ligand-binding SRPBCC domain-containing protein
MDDLVAMLLEALRSEKWNGVYNAVAPQAVTNREFTRELARALHRPALAPVPAIALKAALGEMAQVLLESQRVAPARLIAEGYSFRFPDLPSAFKNLFPGGDRVLEAKQWVPRPLEEVFPFFSEAKNLEELTPAFLNFRIQSISTPGIECGTRIRYQLRIRGVPATWVTHISDWSPPHSFVDEQESGPYSKWHHTHGFEPVAGGTLLTDRVVYRLPVGYLGDLAAGALVKRDVMQIFQYRKQKILERFAY